MNILQNGLTAVIFGASGAVGHTLVPLFLESDKWKKVLCVVRNQPPIWSSFTQHGKLYIQMEKNLDKLFKVQEWKLDGFDAMFVCYGGHLKEGKKQFEKVDKTYPLLCADIALHNKIPHYLVVSSQGSNPKSLFPYTKIKGQMQEKLKQKKLPMVSILKPGLIKNRPDARYSQKFLQAFSFLPFPSIDCLQLGICLKGIAQTKAEQAAKSQGIVNVYENAYLLEFAKSYIPKEYPNFRK